MCSFTQNTFFYLFTESVRRTHLFQVRHIDGNIYFMKAFDLNNYKRKPEERKHTDLNFESILNELKVI